MSRDVLPIDTYLALRSESPAYASQLRDDLHRRADHGQALAADTLAELIRTDGQWWARPIGVPAASDALREAANRAPLFFDTEAA